MNYCPECGAKIVSKIIDGEAREACSVASCHFVHWNNPVPVVAALVQRAGKYVIARNTLWPTGIF